MSAAGPPVEVPSEIVEYLSAQRTLTLATVSSSGVPRASTFLYVNDGPTLYFCLQIPALLLERSASGKRLGLGQRAQRCDRPGSLFGNESRHLETPIVWNAAHLPFRIIRVETKRSRHGA